jgi:hypothetical protein
MLSQQRSGSRTALFDREDGKWVPMRYALALGLMLCATPDGATLAQTSKEYAMMGMKAWAAFECAALALTSDNAKENQRLFTLGYEQGRSFIHALRSGKLQRQDVDGNVPVGLLWKLEGPNVDFMLGRVWEAAYANAHRQIHSASSDSWTLLAQSEFLKRNCSLM